MSEREHHIKVLEKMFYGMEKLENGVILPTSEVKTALAYAISSLKTDLKYDLMYEGEEIYTKADMVAMLTEIQLDIEELQGKYSPYYDEASQHTSEIIQQKINELKEIKDENR